MFAINLKKKRYQMRLNENSVRQGGIMCVIKYPSFPANGT